eukprot:Hpha_TRINITY_DN5480_c0_g1::TRINITY_DN5480_c0_g1_i1::g.192491::m.192491
MAGGEVDLASRRRTDPPSDLAAGLGVVDYTNSNDEVSPATAPWSPPEEENDSSSTSQSTSDDGWAGSSSPESDGGHFVPPTEPGPARTVLIVGGRKRAADRTVGRNLASLPRSNSISNKPSPLRRRPSSSFSADGLWMAASLRSQEVIRDRREKEEKKTGQPQHGTVSSPPVAVGADIQGNILAFEGRKEDTDTRWSRLMRRRSSNSKMSSPPGSNPVSPRRAYIPGNSAAGMLKLFDTERSDGEWLRSELLGPDEPPKKSPRPDGFFFSSLPASRVGSRHPSVAPLRRPSGGTRDAALQEFMDLLWNVDPLSPVSPLSGIGSPFSGASPTSPRVTLYPTEAWRRALGSKMRARGVLPRVASNLSATHSSGSGLASLRSGLSGVQGGGVVPPKVARAKVRMPPALSLKIPNTVSAGTVD